jgi:hypothetical protein
MMTVTLSSGRPAAHNVPRLPDDQGGLHESASLRTDVVDPVRAKGLAVHLPLPRFRFPQPLSLFQPSAHSTYPRDLDFLLSNAHKSPDFLRDCEIFYFRFKDRFREPDVTLQPSVLHLSSLCRYVATSPCRSKPRVVRFAETALRFAETSQQTLRQILLLPTTYINFAEKNALKLKKLRLLRLDPKLDSLFVGGASTFRSADSPVRPLWRAATVPFAWFLAGPARTFVVSKTDSRAMPSKTTSSPGGEETGEGVRSFGAAALFPIKNHGGRVQTLNLWPQALALFGWPGETIWPLCRSVLFVGVDSA